MDVIRIHSAFSYIEESDVCEAMENFEDYRVRTGKGAKDRTTLKLKPASALRLKNRSVYTLVRLAELGPLKDDEDDTEDWSCSRYVVGEREVRQTVWIDNDK